MNEENDILAELRRALDIPEDSTAGRLARRIDHPGQSPSYRALFLRDVHDEIPEFQTATERRRVLKLRGRARDDELILRWNAGMKAPQLAELFDRAPKTITSRISYLRKTRPPGEVRSAR